MQALLKAQCAKCRKRIGIIVVDTADLPEELQAKVNHLILAHRDKCPYYRTHDHTQ